MSVSADASLIDQARLSLLYEFAITPDVFDASVVQQDAELKTILEQLLRGLCENGMVASLDKDRWRQHVMDRVTALPKGYQAHKDKVIRLLVTLHDRKRLVRHPKGPLNRPSSDNDWLQLAMSSHARIPLDGIVVSRHAMDDCCRQDPPIVELSNVLDSDVWQNRRRSVSLRQCEQDYRLVLAPLLRHTRVLDLVDPYMNWRVPRFLDMVRLCSELTGQRGYEPLHGVIRIHAGWPLVKESVQSHLDGWQHELRALVAKHSHRFEVYLWRRQDLHDRFILTDQCAVSIPAGLDCRGVAGARKTTWTLRKTTWTLLDEPDRELHRAEYDPTRSTFKLIDSREIVSP